MNRARDIDRSAPSFDAIKVECDASSRVSFMRPDDASIADVLGRFGTLLEAHVRIEERTPFARAQELLDAPALAQVAPRLAQHLGARGAGCAESTSTPQRARRRSAA